MKCDEFGMSYTLSDDVDPLNDESYSYDIAKDMWESFYFLVEKYNVGVTTEKSKLVHANAIVAETEVTLALLNA